jgi:hypothetical protein
MYVRRSVLLAILLIVSIKFLWALLQAPTLVQSILEIEQAAISIDLEQRAEYLRKRVLDHKFGPNSSPAPLSQAFKEEWAIGTLSMTGAAFANLSMRSPESRERFAPHLEPLIERMLQPDIRVYEERYWGEDALTSLAGDNGHVGYLGHLNFLLGAHRIVANDEKYRKLHKEISHSLARRILARETRYLETFPNYIYIPDNAAAVASLSLFVKAYADPYVQSAVDAWLSYSKANLRDHETSLLVPWVNAQGQGFGRPRGSYATWNIFFLLHVDEGLAEEQARLVKQHFLRTLPGGLCGIKEFLPGVSGKGDIDSGPVVFGFSSSGTGFGLAAAQVLKDAKMLNCLLLTAEVVGSTIEGKNSRRYLLAPLIGDTIILAMRTAQPWE